MGCDIVYYLDHDFNDMTPQGFLKEFQKRIKPLKVTFTGFEGTPYIDISKACIENGWMFYCFDEDFETAFTMGHCFSMRLYLKGRPRVWDISIKEKTFELSIDDEELSFSHNWRWRTFTENYRENKNPDIENRINKLLKEVQEFIIPVFHSTKMIAIGDQGDYQEFEIDMKNGKTIDEALLNEKVNNDYLVKICKHGDSEYFTYKDRIELPVWMCEFSEVMSENISKN